MKGNKSLSRTELLALQKNTRKALEALQDAVSLAVTYLEDGAPASAKDVLQRAIIKPKA